MRELHLRRLSQSSSQRANFARRAIRVARLVPIPVRMGFMWRLKVLLTRPWTTIRPGSEVFLSKQPSLWNLRRDFDHDRSQREGLPDLDLLRKERQWRRLLRLPALQRYVNHHERDGKVRGCARGASFTAAGPPTFTAGPSPIQFAGTAFYYVQGQLELTGGN